MILIQTFVLLTCTYSFLIALQNNLYYTDRVNRKNKDHAIQYNCLYILGTVGSNEKDQRIISYCMNEYSLEFKLENEQYNSRFTFVELAKQQITSEELYLWSAPIDLIETYQFYLEKKSVLLENEVFMNCSWPRFGLQCEYELYLQNIFLTESSTLTCYTHLQCNRQPASACLDWSDICDGKIDCHETGIDEKDCFELELNLCEEDEYRCLNGQCIPKSFQKDGNYAPECLDQSDEITRKRNGPLMVTQTVSVYTKWDQDAICYELLLTSSCENTRQQALLKEMFSVKDESIDDRCWAAFKDLTNAPDLFGKLYGQPCNEMNCLEMIEEYCPEMLFIPNVPVLFGDIYFAYRKVDAPYLFNFGEHSIHYVCINNSTTYSHFFTNYSQILFNGKTCFRPFIPRTHDKEHIWLLSFEYYLKETFQNLSPYKPIARICSRWQMYQCQNSSKCISIFRIQNSFIDCPFGEDENDILMSDSKLIEILQKTHFKCSKSNRYISYVLVNDGVCHCENDEKYWCDDERIEEFNPFRTISFQTICNGFTQLIPQLIDGRNETDETECQYWPCNNIDTRCNGIWNCPDGRDEIGCLTSSILNCSFEYHLCISLETYEFVCLPKEKVLDGNIDCVGATDEPQLCRIFSDNYQIYEHRFYCLRNLSKQCLLTFHICNDKHDCDDESDEHFCTTNRSFLWRKGVCSKENEHVISDREKFFCQYIQSITIENIIYFQLDRTQMLKEEILRDKYLSRSPLIHTPQQFLTQCNYGISLKVWLNNKNDSIETTCLCPATHYGDKCQYQNQRAVLTIQFRALSDSLRTIFAIIISLVDDSQQRIVHSYEQITYVSIRDCQRKFQIYLMYATRPKDQSNNYYLHIDFYEKVSMKYRGSVLLPIRFPFLPVHRLAFIVEIPKNDDNQRYCSNRNCGDHGQCIQYTNEPKTFCQCDPGWSGKECNIQHECTCSSDSICVGITSQNRSICVCPINRFGSRCFLRNTICRQLTNNSSCNHHGFCLTNDDQMLYNPTFTCICSKGYSGDYCELADRKLTLRFEKNILTSNNVFVHFIQVREKAIPLRSTYFQTILTGENAISIEWSLPFHLIFVELERKYYLAYLNQIYNNFEIISQSDRCPNITELFNETLIQFHFLRQIKYYHLFCQNSSLNLKCFHDATQLCLCQNFYNERVANCFVFDHQMKYDCLQQTECENDAACLHDIPDCPARSMCICPACYYGSRCQFSTSGFGLSLDAILGYHISPNISLNHQSSIVQFSFAMTIIFMIVGLVNGIVCMVTFKSKVILEVGCGLYLLILSILSLLIMIIFSWKYFILLFSQMTLISNRKFLLLHCYSIDVILRICLVMNEWLTVCIAIERTMMAVKGARFNKNKSRKAAKYVIVVFLLVIIGSSIHDSFHRSLIVEETNHNSEVRRIWCIVRYNSFFRIYDYAIQSIHFFGVFTLNIVLAVILIWKKSKRAQTIYPEESFRMTFQRQLEKYQHILISPLVLVLLTIPRLIIVLMSKCMQSANDSWLFLIGYFISFLPSMLTFVIFVLPSKFYKAEFRKIIHQFRIATQ